VPQHVAILVEQTTVLAEARGQGHEAAPHDGQRAADVHRSGRCPLPDYSVAPDR
jgi:hypothetical protein